jgi:hypothetical protein
MVTFADFNSLLLFLVFFPRGPTLPIDEAEQQQYTWKTAVTVAFVCLLHGLAVIIVSAALIMSRPDHLGTWANILGITATILAGIQYFPQIWMTWHLGHVGSLSIPMMLIQTPGSFVWSGSLFARLGIEGWSTWGVFLVTGCLQGCLLGMGIYFEVQARNARLRTEGDVSLPQRWMWGWRKLTHYRFMQDALSVISKVKMDKRRRMMKVVPL